MYRVKVKRPENLWIELEKEFLTLYDVVEYMTDPEELDPIYHFMQFQVFDEDGSEISVETLNEHLPPPPFDPPWYPVVGFNRREFAIPKGEPMTKKEFQDAILFKLYEFSPGKWTLDEDPETRQKSILFNGKPTGFCITWQCLDTIEKIPNPQFVIDKMVDAVMKKIVEGAI